MRLLIFLVFLCLWHASAAQRVNLTSLQHEVRWLDVASFPPFAKDYAVSRDMLAYTRSALARKLNADTGTVPPQVAFKLITMFGKPRFEPPAKAADPADYQAAVLSFITRATTGFEVYWEMKAEIRQNGKTIYSKATKHQLLNYEAGVSWFDESSFLQHFGVLIDELLELRPPLAQKYILGAGIDYAEQLRTNGRSWPVSKNANPLGFGMPSFGPYTTLGAGKLDSPVVRIRQVLGKESSLSFSSNRAVSFDQFKTVDLSKRKVCFIELATGPDTLEAIYSVNTRTIESRRTFLSDLLSNDDDVNSGPPSMSNRNIVGVIRTDSTKWQFLIQSYNPDGTIGGGYLSNDEHQFQLIYKQHAGLHREVICLDKDGAYLASLDMRSSSSNLLVLNGLDNQTTHAIAVLYAVLMSTRNVN
jgi:hypothetical protein